MMKNLIALALVAFAGVAFAGEKNTQAPAPAAKAAVKTEPKVVYVEQYKLVKEINLVPVTSYKRVKELVPVPVADCSACCVKGGVLPCGLLDGALLGGVRERHQARKQARQAVVVCDCGK